MDVSVDCRSTAQGLRVRADVSREDGIVLEEMADDQVPALLANGNAAGLWEETLGRVETILLQQTECISRELADDKGTEDTTHS